MTSVPERNVGRPWTDEEDKLLTEAVKIHGERDNWKTIAFSVPGRSNKACRKRWLHSLSPSIKKTAWTPNEDRILLDLHQLMGPKWSTIAREIPGRTDDACSKRYREALDPALKKANGHSKKTPSSWKPLIASAASGGKWRLLERKKLHRTAQGNFVSHATQPHISIYNPSTRRDIPPLFLQTEIMDTPVSPPQNDWLTFYTPEQYPTPLDSPYQQSNNFCITVTQSDVHNAPFQFSSSSLSAALSYPHQFSISPMPAPTLIEDHYDHGASPPISPVSPNNDTISGVDDQPMNLCDVETFQDPLDLDRIMSQVNFNSPPTRSDHALDLNSSGAAVSPLFSPQDMLHPSPLPIHGSPWTPSTPFEAFGLSPIEHPYPLQQYSSLPCEESAYDEFSSANSTPVNPASSLSPTSSPSAISPIDLPSGDPQTAGSLLFSPTQKPREPELSTSRRARKSMIRRALKPPGTARLSASLALSDPSMKPYACGRDKCWPTDASTSLACFSTSRELFDHCKNEHESDPPGDKPFRCALNGCSKSWKTLNGLQYHLQISTAHFRYALSTKFSSQQLRDESSQASATAGSSSDTEASDEAKRVYICRHPNCFKAYKQPSGLRYHMKHGHPVNMPAQLSVVPPVLARQLPAKAKKMRRRASLETEANQ